MHDATTFYSPLIPQGSSAANPPACLCGRTLAPGAAGRGAAALGATWEDGRAMVGVGEATGIPATSDSDCMRIEKGLEWGGKEGGAGGGGAGRKLQPTGSRGAVEGLGRFSRSGPIFSDGPRHGAAEVGEFPTPLLAG